MWCYEGELCYCSMLAKAKGLGLAVSVRHEVLGHMVDEANVDTSGSVESCGRWIQTFETWSMLAVVDQYQKNFESLRSELRKVLLI